MLNTELAEGIELHRQSAGDPFFKVYCEVLSWFVDAPLEVQARFKDQQWNYADVEAIARPDGMVTAEAALLQLGFEAWRRIEGPAASSESFSWLFCSPVTFAALIVAVGDLPPADGVLTERPSQVLDRLARHAHDDYPANATGSWRS